MSDAFNYVAVLVSIVTGLAATNLLSGLSEMIQVANRPRIYWVHTLWLINFFIELMLYWWVLYRWRMAPEWTFFLFVSVHRTRHPRLSRLGDSLPGRAGIDGLAELAGLLLQKPRRAPHSNDRTQPVERDPDRGTWHIYDQSSAADHRGRAVSSVPGSTGCQPVLVGSLPTTRHAPQNSPPRTASEIRLGARVREKHLL